MHTSNTICSLSRSLTFFEWGVFIGHMRIWDADFGMFCCPMQGDTYNSSMTLQHLAANNPKIILNVGDLVRRV